MTVEEGRSILAFPRTKVFEELERFTPWNIAQKLLELMAGEVVWLPRQKAERSDNHVQPIPSALIKDSEGRYLVLQRIPRDRADMSSKLSLVVGGHVDKEDDVTPAADLEDILIISLKRELAEEVGLGNPSRYSPVGLVFDNVSPRASRHIGVIFEVVSNSRVSIQADEEFAKEPAFAGRFMTLLQIRNVERRMDPWSRILLSHYFTREYS